ncbi:MAG TPA: wax ester/triacylglycerol synthase family O-acyltransferase [Solimonas sp.]|nr:wax ester/triacylglycerol synthase family O-acyltransferase [Solimonas sp.]
MSHPLNPLERSWLMLDSVATPMHLGALLIFQLPKGARADHVVRLADSLRAAPDTAAPWNRTLNRRRLRAPCWEEDSQADMDFHVRQSALPAPGGERELGILVSRLHSHPLDLSRPPWECHLIEGLHDGRFALYVKMHHALTDVTGFLRMLTAWLSPDPKRRNTPAPWTLAAPPSERGQAGAQLQESLRSFVRRGEAGASAQAFGSAMWRLLRGGSTPGGDLSAPYSAPHSVMNVRIDAQRRFATQQYPRARLQRIAAACGAELDDLVLYLCGTALRRFFKEYNALPERSFVAAVPGLHKGNPDAETPYGSIGYVSLGTQFADPHKRLAAIQRSTQASREHLDAVPETLLPLYTLATAAPYLLGQLSGMGRLAPAMCNLVIADQPGPEQPLYCEGARLEALYPMFPLTQGTALSITCLHYADTLNIGYCGARETLPSLQRMAVYTGQALDDLEESLAAGALP